MIGDDESEASVKTIEKQKLSCKERIKDKDFLKGISSVIGAIILSLQVGSIYSFCSLAVYEITYIKRNDEENFISIDHLSFYYPFEVLFQCLSSFVSGFMEKKLGMHLTNLVGIIILGVGYFIIYLSKNFFIDILGMIFGGIGTGIIYYPSCKNACLWFMDHNGIIIGIIESAISLGSFLFALIGEKIINPKGLDCNKKDALYSEDIGKKVKTYLKVQIICLVGVYILTWVLMFKKEEQSNIKKEIETVTPLSLNNKSQTESNENENLSADLISKASDTKEPSLNYKQMILKASKSKRFILLAILLILRAPGPAMLFSLYRAIGDKNELDTGTLQLISSVSFIFECLSGIIVGFLADYINLKILLHLINGILTVLLYTFCLTFDNSTAFFWYCNISSFINGGIFPFNDCYFLRVFGTEIYIELMGYISFLNNLAVVAISPLSYYLEKSFDEGNDGGEEEEEEEEEREEEREEEEIGGQEEGEEEGEDGRLEGEEQEGGDNSTKDDDSQEVDNTGTIILFSIFGTLNLISFILGFFLNLDPFDYGIKKKKEEEEKEKMTEMGTTFIE